MSTLPTPPARSVSPDSWSPHLLVGLALLCEAFEAAQAVGRNAWEFAVELGQLHAAGLTNTDLRLLLCRGCAEHGRELPGGDGQRNFHRLANLALPQECCFVLTATGLQFAAQFVPSHATCERSCPTHRLDGPHGPAVRPNWDRKLRQLYWNGFVIKHFRVPAPNQESILTALEEEGWPSRIDDPLSRSSDIDSRERLHDTIKGLNRHRVHRFLSFHGDGTGEGVTWQAAAAPTASPDRPQTVP